MLAVGSLASCSSGGGATGTGGSSVTGSAGTGGSTGSGGDTSTGTGGSVGPGAGFPTQACIDRANSLLAQMTLDEKAAQTIQAERAQITNAQVMQYGVGSIYSQGGSAPSTNTPAGWAAIISGYRTASRASAHGIPIIYGLDSVHGLGPVAGATVFPHNVGLGAIGDPAFIEQVTRVGRRRIGGRGRRLSVRARRRRRARRALGRTYEAFAETPDLVSSLGVAMVNGLQYPTGGTKISILANIKHYLGDGGTALGVTGGPVTGDEAALRALHLAPYRATVAAHAGSVMLSYNTWQGVEMHINKPMITDVLKGELGFGGFVGTDYNGCFQVGLNTHDGLAACSTRARTCS